MRLSSYAAAVIKEFLATGNEEILATYSGELFRARFVSRLWMRRVASHISQPTLIELACSAMRLPILNHFAWHVFFGRGSFPNMEGLMEPQPAT
jgi:hypothetical protein